jgi:hypothetical protein
MSTDTASMDDPARATISEASGFVPPYAPSWVNVLIDRIDRLPGPAWAFYLALMVPAVIMQNAEFWLSGSTPVGRFSLGPTISGIELPGLVWLIRYLNGVASAAFEAFRPALGALDAAAARLRYELTVIPDRPATAITILIVGYVVISYVAPGAAAQLSGITVGELASAGLAARLAPALTTILLYLMLRQWRAVSRIHGRATRIDLFQPAPLYAFSKLTSRNAMALILLATVGVAAYSDIVSSSPAQAAPWFVLPMSVATAAFVLPLQGMHRRLVAEKHRLQAEAAGHLEAVIGEVHAAVEGGDLSRADGLSKLMASLVSEREVVAKLPTWPWQAGTIGGFVGAILLPIGLWLVTRLLEKVV